MAWQRSSTRANDNFYSSKAWRRRRREYLLSVGYRCARCGKVTARLHVHHKVPIENGGKKFPGDDGLEALCVSCHSSETLREFNHAKTDAQLDESGQWSEPDEDGRRWALSWDERQQLKGKPTSSTGS